jgi:sodium/potassium-transporting ATPase subunit alpha
VGSGTFMGRMVVLASSVKSHDTPIAKEIYRIIVIMTALSLIFGVIFYGIGLSMNYTCVESLYFVIGIVVGNIPENLNVTITIILSLTAKRMLKNNCLVKNIHAVETLGSASVILSDKTGTLTQNKMSVAHLWFNEKLAEADTGRFVGSHESYGLKDTGFEELSRVGSLCSRASFLSGNESIPVLIRPAEGDGSDIAILRCMELQFDNVMSYRLRYPKVFEIPFNSTNKYHISVHRTKDSEFPFFLAMKVDNIICLLLNTLPT